MTSLQDMQEALSHSTFGVPNPGIPSPQQQAMLMMQKALSAGNNAFPGAIPPSSTSYQLPVPPGKDNMMAVAAASLGGSAQANMISQYYQMYQKLLGAAALANGQGSPNNGQLPSGLPGHPHPPPPHPHVSLPPSFPSSMPTTSTPTNFLMSSSSLSSPSSTSSALTSHTGASQLESFHHNTNSQGKFKFVSIYDKLWGKGCCFILRTLNYL